MIGLNSIFNASSLAVVGASASPDKTGHIILKNILEGGYLGRIYPINPKADSILGIKCYPSLSEVPENIDLIIIVVPGSLVPGILREAGFKGVKGAVIITGGFGEIGKFQLEHEVLNIAQEFDIRIIGPNCQGFNYTPNSLCASWPLVKAKGPIAIVSQSGTVGATLSTWAENDGIGISGFVALGNKSDVTDLELIDYFSDDMNTGVISLYIEGIKHGQAFINTVTNSRKPVVVLKPGRTIKGQKAVESHTKSIAGSDQVFNAVCKQFGITRANDITEFYDFSKSLGLLKRPKGKNMVVITSSGGSGIIATDVAEENGINVISLKPNIKESLRAALPDHCVLSNPLDLTGDATAERYEKAVSIILNDDDIDILLLIFGDPIPGAFEAIKHLRNLTEKTILVSYLGGGDIEKEEVTKMQKSGIPVFPTPERAVKSVKALIDSKEKGVDRL